MTIPLIRNLIIRIISLKNLKTILAFLKLRENVQVETKFHFDEVNEPGIKDKINSLDKKKPTTFNNIPTRLLVENNDIISPVITDMCNESISNVAFSRFS